MAKCSSIGIFLIVLLSICLAKCDDLNFQNFLKCLPTHTNSSNPILDIVYTQDNPSYQTVLIANMRSRRFMTPETPKPLAIVAAKDETHIQATVICAKSNGIQIRIRSGGHDMEGTSYKSDVPFVILDMFNLRAINIDPKTFSGWVQSGATLGELYYTIFTNISKTHAFPAGVCETVGAGGHFSGGGFGVLMRKYGLSIDNIVDARIVDANGNILDRKLMGEDLFWAIRGGGGGNFGVVIEWLINLVPVPEIVTVFNKTINIQQGATDVVFRWQEVATLLDGNIFIRLFPKVVNVTDIEKTVDIKFIGIYLGQTDALLAILAKSFPELGIERQHCQEVNWIESALFWAGYPPNLSSVDRLTQRPPGAIASGKIKSDFVRTPIPKSGLDAIWKNMIEYEINWMEWNPFGGRMSEIGETETPFAHRAGILFLAEYASMWRRPGTIPERDNNSRHFYEEMTPYVSSNPREAFLNYRDNDIGSNPSNFTDFKEGEIYGHKYYKENFERLARIKAKVDPDNFFKHEQSIPPLFSP